MAGSMARRIDFRPWTRSRRRPRVSGRTPETGWKPKDDNPVRVGRRRAGPARLHRMGRRHADELRAHAVAYVNSDTNGRGYLDIEGSHTLEKFTNEVSRDIIDPETKLSAWKRTSSSDSRSEVRRTAPGDSPARRICAIGALGSGSTSPHFSSTTGRVVEHWFWWRSGGGIYHSIYA